MSFKLGLAGLCTSHPESWVPIIRTLQEEGRVDCQVVACWDGAETRPAGYAREFARKLEIPHALDTLGDMLDLVDGVIVHTTNWDRHVEQARPFVEAGKPVLIDKPLAGNMADLNQLLDWAGEGKRVTGGSSLRFTVDVRRFLERPVGDRGTVHTAFAGCGVDEFNYGIHAYALICQLMGPGIQSVQCVGASLQRHIKVTWTGGRIGYLSVGAVDKWLPFHCTAVTNLGVEHFSPAGGNLYRPLLEACLPYMAGDTDAPPLPMAQLVEPELAALAARQSWLGDGRCVFLDDLRHDDAGYDGTQFAIGYRRARLGASAN